MNKQNKSSLETHGGMNESSLSPENNIQKEILRSVREWKQNLNKIVIG